MYSTFKAIENRDQNQQQKWLIYWAGCIIVTALFYFFSSSTTLSQPPCHFYHMAFDIFHLLSLQLLVLSALLKCSQTSSFLGTLLKNYRSLITTRVLMILDKLWFFYRFPLYYHAKFAFLVWLQLPTIDVLFPSFCSHP